MPPRDTLMRSGEIAAEYTSRLKVTINMAVQLRESHPYADMGVLGRVIEKYRALAEVWLAIAKRLQ